jgi:AcrR family transcriptional regulator
VAENPEELRRRGDLLWSGGARPSRGPKRGLSADEVIAAAMGIADREGLGALTMQAVAKEVGFTTMALYRYFPSKEALVDAIVDAAWGTPPERKEPKGDWRGEVERWAWAKRAVMISRPWLGELPFIVAPHGPNWLAWLEWAVEALALSGLGAGDVFDMLHAVDGYVRGGSDTAISLAKATARGASIEEWKAAVAVDLVRTVGNPRYPTLSALIQSGLNRDNSVEDNFEFGLQRVLDGCQMYVDSSRNKKTGKAKPSSASRRRA